MTDIVERLRKQGMGTDIQDTARWNRCDVCGKFIAIEDFGRGAVRDMVTPDSERSRETWETLCVKHASKP